MSERIKMISSYVGGDFAISELAAEYGVSRKTVYKWIERHEVGGWSALADRSRAPRHHPNAVAAEVEQTLVELKERWPLWGAPKLRRKLEAILDAESLPAESTVSEILRRHGLSRIARRRRRAVPSTQPFAACQAANALWCADFKGWFRTGDGSKCTPLTISDGHSRYLLRCQGLDGSTGDDDDPAALHRHLPGVRVAAGDANRQRRTLCQHGSGRPERTVGVVGSPRY